MQVSFGKDGIKIDHSGPKSISEIPRDIRMVIIEDNKINSFYMSQLFDGFGNVRVFLNSSDALDFILTNPVDLILTDLHMPGSDGWDV
ncbi:two-component system response regulator [Sphingobacterium daejeonense]|uniref:Two-component system response regulator n=1 Tax=Sphingobacterium daejeonense TaxID=371142 RepID=A0ABW3RLP9_9SPHI